ncbi:hypothetical protein FACS189451_05590 [Bacteroidia bacterium]|nr:hypothetical protein FACS189446_1390 [Bacteroidia bacterium]GHT62086.1 hypothetical protein FACS189451_05590 [Bacteroidia bacterium]
MKSIYNLRFWILMLMISVFFTNGTAQSVRTSYFMESASSRTLLNPALRPNQGYISVPGLGNSYVDAKTNTFNMDHFSFRKNNDLLFFMNENVGTEEFMKNISGKNYLDFGADLTVLSAGWYSGKGFWSLNFALRAYGDANIPKDFFRLAKEGFGIEEKNVFDLSNTGAEATAFGEFGLGYSRTFGENDNLTLGFRVKYLSGICNFRMKTENLRLEVGSDDWRISSNAILQMSARGIQIKHESDDDYDTFDLDDTQFSLAAGYGLGLDLGFEYQPVDRLKISGAITDLGVIRWSGNNSVSLRAQGETAIDPDNLIFSVDNEENFDAVKDHFDHVLDNLEKAVKPKEDANSKDSRTTRLRTTLNIGAGYDFIKDKFSVGLLSSTIFNPYHTVSEFTVSANYTPVDWLSISGSHSLTPGFFKTFGLALHLAPSKGLNLFIASDYLIPRVNSDFIPTTSKAVSVQVGVTIPIGGKRK